MVLSYLLGAKGQIGGDSSFTTLRSYSSLALNIRPGEAASHSELPLAIPFKMPTVLQTDARTTRFFEHIHPEPSKTSFIYSILPHLIKRRIEKIPSLRKAVSQHDRLTYHYRAPSQSSSSSIAPPPSYRLSASEDFEAICSPVPSRPSSSGSATPNEMDESNSDGAPTSSAIVPFHRMHESRSGVQYKYVKHGSSLLIQSTHEATSPSEDPQFSRQLYVDSVKYLLRGLPRDLAVDEVTTLRAAAASRLGPTPQNANISNSLGSHETQKDEPDEATAPASLLQVVIAFIALYFFLGITKCWPWLQRGAQQLQLYNHDYGISDKVLSHGIAAADSMIRWAFMLISTVWAIKNGTFSIAVRGTASWLIVGVTKGLYDGLGEGMRRKGLHMDLD